MKKPIAIIGYSGHGYVVCDAIIANSDLVSSYCDKEQKKFNPYNLSYLGNDSDEQTIHKLKQYEYFISIGNNATRKSLFKKLNVELSSPVNVIHPSAIVTKECKLKQGILIGANVVVNPLTYLGNGVICNTGSIIEHECIIKDFVHIAPGAVLCGNVKIGEGTLVGANSVIRPGIKIGENVIIGAGSVVVKDISDNQKIVGNPSKSL